MKLEPAIRFIRELRRYDNHACTIENDRGKFLKQTVIPQATAREFKQAEQEADTRYQRDSEIEWVEIATLRSAQTCLFYRGLLWRLRRHNKSMPSWRRQPTVIRLKNGTHVIWDGNHRVTSAIMLGHTRIRCAVIRKAA